MHILVRELAERWLPVIRNNPRLVWAAALGLFALAFVLRWVLEGILPVGLPFITFFIAILLATSRRKNSRGTVKTATSNDLHGASSAIDFDRRM